MGSLSPNGDKERTEIAARSVNCYSSAHPERSMRLEDKVAARRMVGQTIYAEGGRLVLNYTVPVKDSALD
jgi:hypothetical protein